MPNTEAKEAGHVTFLSGPSDRTRGRIRLGKHRSFLQKKDPELYQNQPTVREKDLGRPSSSGTPSSVRRRATRPAAPQQLPDLGRGAGRKEKSRGGSRGCNGQTSSWGGSRDGR
jgi:hypothetical protein